MHPQHNTTCSARSAYSQQRNQDPKIVWGNSSSNLPRHDLSTTMKNMCNLYPSVLAFVLSGEQAISPPCYTLPISGPRERLYSCPSYNLQSNPIQGFSRQFVTVPRNHISAALTQRSHLLTCSFPTSWLVVRVDSFICDGGWALPLSKEAIQDCERAGSGSIRYSAPLHISTGYISQQLSHVLSNHLSPSNCKLNHRCTRLNRPLPRLTHMCNSAAARGGILQVACLLTRHVSSRGSHRSVRKTSNMGSAHRHTKLSKSISNSNSNPQIRHRVAFLLGFLLGFPFLPASHIPCHPTLPNAPLAQHFSDRTEQNKSHGTNAGT